MRLIRRPSVAVALCAVSAGAVAYLFHYRPVRGEEATANYRLVYSQPSGWRSLPHTPELLFIFRHDGREVQMRAAMSNIVDDTNPTPDLDADAITAQYASVSEDRLPGWHSKVMDVVDGRGVKFRLLRRWRDGRCIVSAIGVRGNSTILIALSANGDADKKIDSALPDFRSYLASLAFERYVFPDPFAETTETR